MARRSAAALAVAIVAASSLAALRAVASPAEEADFVSRINAERRARGIPELVARADLTAVARDWSERMAARGSISHDPDLPEKVSGWSALGDNVGKGPSVRSIHNAFMASDVHRRILLDPAFDEIGVGVAWGGDTLYVTQVLVRRSADARTAHARPRASGSPGGRTGAASSAVLEDALVAATGDGLVAATGRIWSLELTPPLTVEHLLRLAALDAA